MIHISNLSKWYGEFRVLTDCSTSIAKGEVVVVCGPSGSGKSTLIKCVNALEPFQQGDLVVDGLSIADPKTNLPKLRSRVGMVFQHFELFPHLSIIDNLTLAQIKVLGRSRDAANTKGHALLARVGLTAQADKFPGQLSGGQQQRVAIARALANDPDVIIGCTGGGSNFAGIAFPFMGQQLRGEHARRRFVAVEPAACPSLSRGKFAYDFGDTSHLTPLVKMHTLGSTFTPPGFHAGGLRYHGMAPMVSHIASLGLIEAQAYQQKACFEAGVLFARTEGIVPAPEATHAIKGAVEEALRCKREGKAETILFCLSGHGHMDMSAYQAYFDGKLFSLERLEHRICRRDPTTGAEEKCWSFVAAALAEGRAYPEPYGVAEALWLDQEGAWLGLDNNDLARADGERRPLLWQFKAPAGGWSAP